MRGLALALPAVLVLLLASSAQAGELTLVPQGATWRYLDTVAPASAPPAGWQQPGFDDSAWASGPAQLGYGESDEATLIGFGGDPADKHRATYFRHVFGVVDPAVISNLNIGLERDDGAIVYLNGSEIWRSNMPAGAVGAGTFALSSISGSEEGVLTTRDVDPALLVAGDNVIAVEVHQSSPGSSDLSFRLDVVCESGPLLKRGPYLQSVGSDRATVRWRTTTAQLGRLRFGADPGVLDQVVDGPVGLDHVLEVSGLAPGTRYFYAIETASQRLAGGDAQHFFRTAPPLGDPGPTRIWVVGDSGEGNQAAADVRDDFLAYPAGGQADVWLMLGDNAYDDGTDLQYQRAVFDLYPTILRNTPLWPAFGNHDAHAAYSPAEDGPYFDLFSLPRAGEAGGLPSGTEAYYAFDHANIHFIVLDSQGSDPSPSGAMMTWAAADLASTTQDWVIVTFHHPPYTKGSHDSDDVADSGGRMFDVREIMLPILEAGGVDLVLAGHSHVYERSLLLDGHYGVSGTFSPATHAVDAGDGCICPPATTCAECPLGGSGAYAKPSAGPAAHEGAVYSVVGSSSKATGSLPLDHPVMLVSLREIGAMVVDVSANRLDAVWIERGGTLRDRFTLRKGGDEDGDGVADGIDSCRYAPNPGQEAAACLCGDVDASAALDVRDAVVAARASAGLGPGLAAPERCVLGTCAAPDVVATRRALVGLPTPLDVCPAATPAPCGDGVCAGETADDCPQDCGCSATATCDALAAPGGCFCDAACLGFGDCCRDACEVCGSCASP